MKTKTMKLSGYAFVITLGLGLAATSCSSDDSSSTPLPAIGGYANANEVGAADLVAYWPLNGSGVESKSSTAPDATVGASYEAGAKGQGLKLNAGYMKFPSIPALAAITGNITVSAWVKLTNQKLTPDAVSTISPIISLTNPNENVGNLSFFGNTHGLVSSDSIQMKAEFKVKKADGSTFGGDCVRFLSLLDD